MMDAWVGRALEHVASWDGLSIEERNRRAHDFLAQLPVDLPPAASRQTPVVPESQRRSSRYPHRSTG